MSAAMRAVPPPIQAMTVAASGEASMTKLQRTSMKTPAATIVAAWIRAETGVGPSMASGSQTCSGNWALLPTAPIKMHSAANIMNVVFVFAIS